VKIVQTYLLKFFPADKLVVISLFEDLFRRPGSITDLLLENAIILLENLLHEGIFTNA
jgi:hypothetical protein